MSVMCAFDLERKRVTIFTTAHWLSPLGVKLDDARRCLLLSQSVYVRRRRLAWLQRSLGLQLVKKCDCPRTGDLKVVWHLVGMESLCQFRLAPKTLPGARSTLLASGLRWVGGASASVFEGWGVADCAAAVALYLLFVHASCEAVCPLHTCATRHGLGVRRRE